MELEKLQRATQIKNELDEINSHVGHLRSIIEDKNHRVYISSVRQASLELDYDFFNFDDFAILYIAKIQKRIFELKKELEAL